MIRVALAVLVGGALGACTGDSPTPDRADEQGAGVAATPSSTGPRTRQHQFHPELIEALRLRLDQMVPERFNLDQKSVQVVDTTRGEVEFQRQKELGEFARSQGLLGYGVADFTASGGLEYWGMTTYAFQHTDGARATFERFPDPETVAISDATKINTQGESYGGGFLGNLTVETYSSEDGVTTLFLRASLVDGGALHYVSAVIDVRPGEAVDGLTELRRVMKGFEGLYPALFAEYLEQGGTDEAPTTTTVDPTFVPGEPDPGEE